MLSRWGRAGRLKVHESGDSFPKMRIICVTLCSECIASSRQTKPQMNSKGSDGESKLFSVKENNGSWMWGWGTAGRRRRGALRKQRGDNPSGLSHQNGQGQQGTICAGPSAIRKIPPGHNYVTLSLLRHKGTNQWPCCPMSCVLPVVKVLPATAHLGTMAVCKGWVEINPCKKKRTHW